MHRSSVHRPHRSIDRRPHRSTSLPVTGPPVEGVRVRVGEGVSQANHDAFRPCLSVSSGGFDSVTTRNDPKITSKLHNLPHIKCAGIHTSVVSLANHDAFRPCLRVSSGSYDFPDESIHPVDSTGKHRIALETSVFSRKTSRIRPGFRRKLCGRITIRIMSEMIRSVPVESDYYFNRSNTLNRKLFS